jgi:hypothetical protein
MGAIGDVGFCFCVVGILTLPTMLHFQVQEMRSAMTVTLLCQEASNPIANSARFTKPEAKVFLTSLDYSSYFETASC